MEVEYKHTDNRLVAIIAMNIAAASTVGMTASYKTIAEDGFRVVEFTFFRNVSGLIFSSIWLLILGYNPFKMFPSDKKCIFFWRIMTGQVGFLILNLAVPITPLSLIMVIWSTSPFFVSIIAFFMLSEPVYPLEILAMAVCFSAVVVIAFQAGETDDAAIE